MSLQADIKKMASKTNERGIQLAAAQKAQKGESKNGMRESKISWKGIFKQRKPFAANASIITFPVG
jgi:hypothetical protein